MSSDRAVSATFQSCSRSLHGRKARSASSLNSSNDLRSSGPPSPPAVERPRAGQARRRPPPSRACPGARMSRPLDGVAQLAHVAGPVERRAAARPRLASNVLGATPSLADELRERSASTSSGMSSRRSRSGGTCDRHDVEPVEQVLAEAARRDLGLQVLVGGRQHPDVHLRSTWRRRSASPRLPAARGAPWPGPRATCRRSRRGRACRRRPARTCPARSATAPVKRPLHVPEQLALDQLRRDRGAVDLDERPVARGATGLVERARHQLLAGAVLAGDEHPRGRGGRPCSISSR